MEDGRVDGIVLGDSGYPQRRWLFTPIPHPRDVVENRYNVAHRRTRTWMEHAFGLLKMRWRVLHSECRLQPVKLCKVASVCAMLHNIAIDYAGADEGEEPDHAEDDENDENTAPAQQEDARDFNVVRRDYVVRYFAH
ncbi:nuclease HARBI1-like protein [Aphelenchoides avenae]|nr:nuclease HARBI1-like protein [Aphelenchus avenae]